MRQARGFFLSLLGAAMNEHVVTSQRLADLSAIEGIRFLFDGRGNFLEEINTWQFSQGLKTHSRHTRATRSSAIKGVVSWFEQRNLRWQDCTELAHMNLMRREMRGAGNAIISKNTWNQWMTHWYQFLRFAEHKGHIDEIGFEPRDVAERGKSVQEIRALSPEEFRLFMNAARSQRLKAGCAVFVGTGMRAAELAGLTVSDVPNPDHPRNRHRSYLEASIIGKGRKERTIYWPLQAVKHVAHYIAVERELSVDALIGRVKRNLVNVKDTFLTPGYDPATGQITFIEQPTAPLWLTEQG